MPETPSSPEQISAAESVKPLVKYAEKIKTPEGVEFETNVEWEKVTNQYGDVEVSTLRGDKPAEKAVFYSCGLAGRVDIFKSKFAKNLIDEGYDVVLVHRNGTDLTQPSPAVDSPKRLELAKEQGEDHLGSLPEYGYKEWCAEFSTAAHGVGNRYKDIKFVGNSFGSLVGLEGMRQLRANNDPVAEKISSYVSLSGQIGLPEKDDQGRLWIDKSRKYAVSKVEGAKTSFEGILGYLRSNVKAGGGIAKMKDTPSIVQEYLDITSKLYEPTAELPSKVDYVLVQSWKESYFATQQARKLMDRVGDKAVFVADRTQKGTPGERHSMPELTAPNLVKWLNIEPQKLEQRVYTLSDVNEDIKPVKWLGGGK